MSELNEASQGPSSDTPVSGEIVEALTAETTLDDDLSAAWDRANGAEDPKEELPQDEAAVEPENEENAAPETVEEPAEEVEFPSDLPGGLRDHWKDIPKAARDAIAASQLEMSNKYSTANRELAAFRPIRGALEQAIQSHPAIANMRPEEVAADIPRLVKIGRDLNENPVQTLLGFAQQKGVLDQLAQALTGQEAQGGNEAALMREIAGLKQQISGMANPDMMRQQFDSMYRTATVEQEVMKFAGEAEDWGEVEQYIPQTIPLAQNKLGEGASARSVLEEAHKMAIQLFMPAKAPKPAPVEEAVAEVDPEQVQKAQNAKSVNVKAKSNGKARAATLDDELSAIWDKAVS